MTPSELETIKKTLAAIFLLFVLMILALVLTACAAAGEATLAKIQTAIDADIAAVATRVESLEVQHAEVVAAVNHLGAASGDVGTGVGAITIGGSSFIAMAVIASVALVAVAKLWIMGRKRAAVNELLIDRIEKTSLSEFVGDKQKRNIQMIAEQLGIEPYLNKLVRKVTGK